MVGVFCGALGLEGVASAHRGDAVPTCCVHPIPQQVGTKTSTRKGYLGDPLLEYPVICERGCKEPRHWSSSARAGEEQHNDKTKSALRSRIATLTLRITCGAKRRQVHP